MKNQRAVYLLLPLVLLIWGLIGWRVWAAAGEPEEESMPQLALTRPAAASDSTQRPRLLLTYTDPFYPAQSSEPAEVVPAGSPSPVTYVKSAPRLTLPIRPVMPASTSPAPIWPSIKYLGSIAHTEGKAQVALLTINGEETTLRIGRGAQGVQVVRLFRDSVQMLFGKQQHTFYRAAL